MSELQKYKVIQNVLSNNRKEIVQDEKEIISICEEISGLSISELEGYNNTLMKEDA